MQRLANVARSIAAPVFVLVKVGTAGGKVEKRDSSQQGQCAARGQLSENSPQSRHIQSNRHFSLAR